MSQDELIMKQTPMSCMLNRSNNKILLKLKTNDEEIIK